MERERTKFGSRVLLVLSLTTLALPAWGANSNISPNAPKPAPPSPVTSVTATAPLTSTGGKTPIISLTGIIPVANGGTGTTDGLASMQKKVGNVAIVAKSGGDYTSPVTAMEDVATWCGTPSSTNPCLVKIMPGVYDLAGVSLIMQAYVDIEGSGETVTVITSSVTASLPAGVVNGADNAELSFITIRNDTLIDPPTPIVNNGASPKITHVTVIGESGVQSNSYAIYNTNSSPIMSNVTVTGGGYYFFGIYNTNSSPAMSNVAVKTSGYSSYGVYNTTNSSPQMSNVTITCSSARGSYGVYSESSSPFMNNVNITSSSSLAGGSYGVYNSNSSPTMSNFSVISNGVTTTYGVYNSNSSPTMGNFSVTSQGTTAYGVYNSNSSPTMNNVTVKSNGFSGAALTNSNSSTSTATILVDRSTFEASGPGSSSVNNTSNVVLRIGASKLIGTVQNSGTLTCAASYNGDFVALGTNCQ